MKLLTDDQRARLLQNAERQAELRGTEQEINFEPVVKLFNPYGLGTWLITELDPESSSIAFGLADLGDPEIGYFCLDELGNWRHPVFRSGIERDLHFTATMTLSRYADEARAAGRIVA